jgi:hypothetical protein
MRYGEGTRTPSTVSLFEGLYKLFGLQHGDLKTRLLGGARKESWGIGGMRGNLEGEITLFTEEEIAKEVAG